MNNVEGNLSKLQTLMQKSQKMKVKPTTRSQHKKWLVKINKKPLKIPSKNQSKKKLKQSRKRRK